MPESRRLTPLHRTSTRGVLRRGGRRLRTLAPRAQHRRALAPRARRLQTSRGTRVRAQYTDHLRGDRPPQCPARPDAAGSRSGRKRAWAISRTSTLNYSCWADDGLPGGGAAPDFGAGPLTEDSGLQPGRHVNSPNNMAPPRLFAEAVLGRTRRRPRANGPTARRRDRRREHAVTGERPETRRANTGAIVPPTAPVIVGAKKGVFFGALPSGERTPGWRARPRLPARKKKTPGRFSKIGYA